nr:MAG TPA: hypothetical protein [Caudoviricetes sp.]
MEIFDHMLALIPLIFHLQFYSQFLLHYNLVH